MRDSDASLCAVDVESVLSQTERNAEEMNSSANGSHIGKELDAFRMDPLLGCNLVWKVYPGNVRTVCDSVQRLTD